MTDTIDTAASSAGAGGKGRSLGSLKLPELQALASQLGVKGTSKMRKSDLVAAIGSTGGSPSGATSGSAPASRTRQPARAAQGAGASDGAARPDQDRPAEQRSTDEQARNAPAKRGTSRTRPEAADAVAAALSETSTGTRAAAEAPARTDDRAARAAAAVGTIGGEERGSRRAGRAAGAARGEGQDAQNGQNGQGEQGGKKQADDARGGDTQPGGNRDARDGRDNRDNGSNAGANGSDGSDRRQRNSNQSGQNNQGGGQNQNRNQGGNRNDRNDDEGGSRRRRGRDRGRDRKRSGRGNRSGPGDMASLDEVELSADDVLIPVAGILDVLDSYAFVRTSGYLPGQNDVYVSLGQVKKAGLRRGDAVTGAVRQPQGGDDNQQGQSARQKFNALVRLDTVNGLPPEQARQRADFTKLTPLYPQERLRLENDESTRLTPRVIDIVAPIGKGQRGLIVAPPKAGKTIIMQQIANAITTNNPEVHLMVVLVDERPEEVTDMERTVKGEVIASTFDRPASDHTIVAELAIERAKRLVELGQDVVVLLDSLTRLSRAYNLAAPASGRILSGGVDASALYPPKRFFGAARNIENGGSLTILASALVETGSKMDEVIFEEFKGTGNMELRLSRNLADKRIFPAVDVNASGTRREEVLLSRDELGIVYKLRRVLGGLDQQQAIELMLGKLKDTKTNVEFLLQVQKTTPANFADGDQPGRTV
ncbi:hypothetical protein GCM10025865_22510 [Paraoerskovia sediminicola]|uniref:Transcription termination factor Rho n=1 Tax=Paraoerskovia sediminicola TaxID=1138587 RepID=A0ABN6XDD3_9CELL|nr:transcription termination factor Rho [Paraoerskovia sediminicola]BDZ42952.1 hypothetical protein GCM10025865_22510 [Paraoerskovia sediminicola]